MRYLVFMAFALNPVEVFANPPVVEGVTVSETGDSRSFSVTILHPDTGWEHYADGWEVLAPDGTRLGFRELLHPHETEQPFTRSLGAVPIPAGVTQVLVRAKCSVDGWNDMTTEVDLPN